MSLIPYDFERPFRMLENYLCHPSTDFDVSPFNQLVPKDFFAPHFFKPYENMFRPFEELSNAINRLAVNEVGGAKISADDEKFQVNVDVHHFKPEEINVKVVNGQVTIEGNHEEKIDQHGYVSRQFVRRYALPQGCLPDTVQSKLSSDGVLTVTAPRVLPMPSIGEKIVPIQHTGPVKKILGPSGRRY